MQLGELQSQLSRFTDRGVNVVALSVDPGSHSRSMIRRLGLKFPLLSDENQAVQKAWHVVNPDTEELALHAVFIVDQDRRIFYRKVASRRPKSQELLDAIDYHQGNYPMADQPVNHDGAQVAFPVNDFQALIELSTNSTLPGSINPDLLTPIIGMIHSGRLDDATVSYRKVVDTLAATHSEAQLLATAAWLTKTTFELPEEAVLTGRALNQALVLEREVSTGGVGTLSGEREAVQKDLETLRATVRINAVSWRLRQAKTTLRSYRELSLAALR